MMKKIILLFTLILVSVFYQNMALADTNLNQEMYLSYVKHKIDSHWFEPVNSTGKGAVLTFDINQDGTFSNVTFLRSSNDEAFDKSALEAIYKASQTCPVSNNLNMSVQIYMNTQYMNIGKYDKNQLPIDGNSGIINVANRDTNGDFTDYTSNMQSQLESQWKPKYKKEREAIVSVKIDKDGALNDIKFLKTSRKAKFNKEVVDVISNSVPFSPLPDKFSENSKNVILTFEYNYDRKSHNSVHFVSAEINNAKGYDEYTDQIESVISNAFEGKRYFWYRDAELQISIDKTGKLEYVKLKKSSSNKSFDRFIMANVQKLSFPPIPNEMNTNNFTTNYHIVTQRGMKVKDLLIDYFVYFGTKRLNSFCI